MDYKKLLIELIQNCDRSDKLKLVYRFVSNILDRG